MLYEGNVLELGCCMLAKNRPQIILDNGKLDNTIFDYWWPFEMTFFPFIKVYLSMWSPAAPIGSVDSCQWIPEVLLKDPRSHAILYEDVLYYWKRLLFLGSMAQGTLPNHCLTLRQCVSQACKD